VYEYCEFQRNFLFLAAYFEMPVVSSASVAVSQFQERILVETGLASYLERGVKDSERMRIEMC